MLANGIGDFDQPRGIFGLFQNVGSRKKLHAVWGRIAERLEQPGIDQRGDVMRLTVQHPARLLRRQAGGQLAEQRQEPMMIVFHIHKTSHPCAQNRTDENDCQT